MNIYLIRHGRQCSRLCNVNAALSEEGRLQAELVGERLSLKKIDAVYSSNLIRAVETAQIANSCWNAKHIIRSELREISFGDMEGMADDDIAAAFAGFKKEQEKMEEDLPYPGGECAGDVIERAMPVFEEIAASGAENTVVVTHGGVIRCITAAFLKMAPMYYRILGNTLENCSITHVRWNQEKRRYSVERFNDYAHLEQYPELLRESWAEAEN